MAARRNNAELIRTMLQLCCGNQVASGQDVCLSQTTNGIELEFVGEMPSNQEQIERAWGMEQGGWTDKLLFPSQLSSFGTHHRNGGHRIVFTNGCFDALHIGHLKSLTEAAQWGDILVVGINSDASVRRIKGPTRPIFPERDRARMLTCLACVTAVVIFEESTPCRLLELLRPDVLVKGGTYTKDQVVGRDIVKAYGGTVHVTETIEGISTTQIIESLQQQYFDRAGNSQLSSSTAH